MNNTQKMTAKTNSAILQVLANANDHTMPKRDILRYVEESVEYNDWENEIMKSGKPRWRDNFSYYSLSLVKAGWLVRNNGVWYITEEGCNAIKNMNSETLFNESEKAYREWERKRKRFSDSNYEDGTRPVSFYETAKEYSEEDIQNYIDSLNPYEFQNLVAALLRTLGYKTPFVAPRGKDGGVDIIAYSDPLGALKPILKVQVKHYSRDNAVGVDVIHNIIGVAKNDVPLVVTSGRFTADAIFTARINNVRLIDGTEFISLWKDYYKSMDEEDKLLMPIEPIYFIRRTE